MNRVRKILRDAARSVPQTCGHCGKASVPRLHHILWECETFSHLRKHTQHPDSVFLARLGWDGQTIASRDILLQMSNIRAHDAALRDKRHRDPGADGGGPLPPGLKLGAWRPPRRVTVRPMPPLLLRAK